MLRLSPLFSPSDLSQNVVKRALKIELLTQKNRLKGGFSMKGGPSDRIRTCGILLPKQARYQLRYTRLLSFLSGWAYSPKCRALPVELHPVIHFSVIIPRRGGKSKIFCLWSSLWSKPLLCRFQQPGEIQQTQASQGFAAFFLALSRI